MTLKKLEKCVLQAGYSVAIGDDVSVIELDGGAPRFRRKRAGTYHEANVTWVAPGGGYQYLIFFYKRWAKNPNQPFLIGLIADTGALFDHEAFFISAPTLSSKEGDVFTVTATLKFKPQEIDDELFNSILELPSVYQLTNPLEKLVNEDLPDSVEKL